MTQLPELSITIDGDWLGGTRDVDDATLAPIRIQVGDEVLTEVQDRLARTTRPHVRLPASRLATHLVAHYWRLCCEPRGERRQDWRWAHALGAIGSGYAWPPLEISGDGELVELDLGWESRPDGAGVHYLRSGSYTVSRASFDRAVDTFARPIARRAREAAGSSALDELIDELRAEVDDPPTHAFRTLEARAGIDSDESPADWRQRAVALGAESGQLAAAEMVSVAPLDQAEAFVRAARRAAATVDLSCAQAVAASSEGLPWERGVSMARAARRALSIGDGPIEDTTLGRLLQIDLPVGPNWKDRHLAGAYRDGANGHANVLIPGRHPSSQRFYFARLIAAAALSGSERVLAITSARTSSQKAIRAFAQELLLPWAELDERTDREGLDEDVIGDIAAEYGVSERLVETTLVNNGKLERTRLEDRRV